MIVLPVRVAGIIVQSLAPASFHSKPVVVIISLPIVIVPLRSAALPDIGVTALVMTVGGNIARVVKVFIAP